MCVSLSLSVVQCQIPSVCAVFAEIRRVQVLENELKVCVCCVCARETLSAV
jgi:hypothetical protein